MRISLVLSLLAAAASAQEASPQTIVVKITFVGNRRYDDAFLAEQISTKVGRPLDPGLLTRDERILSEYFSSVLEITEKKVEGGVEIIFEVFDNLIVGNVRVLGSFVKEDDYKPLMSTRRRRPLLDYSLNSDKRLLERLHREKGYPFTSVQVIRHGTKDDKVQDITFQVLADKKVKVVEIIFEGAKSIKPSKLLGVMESPSKTAKRRYWSTLKNVLLTPLKPIGNLLDESSFRRETVEADRARIEGFYREEGYRDARVVLVRTGFNATRTQATVHYRITEGPRYMVRTFAVEYAPGGEPRKSDRQYLSPDALEALATLLPGSPFRGLDLLQSRNAISERLWSRAYAQAVVEMSVFPVGQKPLLDITVTITAKEKVRLGEIRIIGNRWTRDNVIRRQFQEGALPGEYLNVEALLDGQRRLLNLQYFDQVEFAGRGTGRQWGLVKSANKDRPAEYDIEIELHELDTTRQFRIGGAVDTDGGANANLDITWTNFDIRKPPGRVWDLFEPGAFRGGGQEFTISLSPGTRNSYYRLSFSEPALRDSRWYLNVNGYRQLNNTSDDYSLIVDGVAIAAGRFLDLQRRWRVSLDWSLRQVLLHDPQPDAPVNAIDEQGYSTLHGIRISLIRERRRAADPFLNGHITRLSAQYLGGVLGGDVDIVKTAFSHFAGWKLFSTKRGHHRFRIRFFADWAQGFDDTAQVPIYERYFLGGRNLRGFKFREVGPRSNGRPSGGEFMARVSMEYTIPVVNSEGGVGIDFVIFVDQGGLATTARDWNSEVWRISAGFAIGVSFKLGGRLQPPLMIEFGWPIRSQTGDERQVVSVSFSGRF